MAAASRILPTSGAGFGASDNGRHRGNPGARGGVFRRLHGSKDAGQARCAGSVAVPGRASHFAPQWRRPWHPRIAARARGTP